MTFFAIVYHLSFLALLPILPFGLVQSYVLSPFRSRSFDARFGGRTTIVDFVPNHKPASSRRRTARFNFLKDVLGGAFANDDNLSQNNKRVGMLDEGLVDEQGDDAMGGSSTRRLTATQQAWRQTMMQTATISDADVEGSCIRMDLFLTGVPSKDPSNDLYGSKTNISSRDRVVGQILPTEPTVRGVQVVFLANQKCRVQSSTSGLAGDDDGSGAGFCQPESVGDWRLSEGGDNRQIRFRIAVTGYNRTVQTKGSIQKIYWSSQDEVTTQTSTTYSIPAGWLYFEADVAPGRPTNDGSKRRLVSWSEGIAKVEQPMGFLGVASKMVPCGKFIAQTILVDSASSS